jgi:hypothetical protein
MPEDHRACAARVATEPEHPDSVRDCGGRSERRNGGGRDERWRVERIRAGPPRLRGGLACNISSHLIADAADALGAKILGPPYMRRSPPRRSRSIWHEKTGSLGSQERRKGRAIRASSEINEDKMTVISRLFLITSVVTFTCGLAYAATYSIPRIRNVETKSVPCHDRRFCRLPRSQPL